MTDHPKEDTYSEEETAARREAALKRMLNTPHEKHKPLKERRERAKARPRSQKQEY